MIITSFVHNRNIKKVKYMSMIVEIAELEIGYKEEPKNSNKTKYGKWFGFDGVAWCAIFVSCVYDNAGFSLGNIGFRKGYAGCMTAIAHFNKTKEITNTPITGDMFSSIGI